MEESPSVWTVTNAPVGGTVRHCVVPTEGRDARCCGAPRYHPPWSRCACVSRLLDAVAGSSRPSVASDGGSSGGSEVIASSTPYGAVSLVARRLRSHLDLCPG